MRNARIRCGVVILSSLFSACGDDGGGQAPRATHMYWSASFNENGAIRRANLDGSEVVDVVQAENAVGVAIDSVGAQLYWASGFVVPSGTIRRANLDGSQIADVLPDLPFPYAVSIDQRDDKIYWTEIGARGAPVGVIWRANLDGSDVEDLVEGRYAPGGIAIDASRNRVYWTEFGPIGGTGALWRADLDGGNIQALVEGIDFTEGGVAVDATANMVYWTTAGGVQRARADGSDVEEVAACVGGAGIALDVPARKMYWTCFTDQTIQRADLDGRNAEHLVDEPDIPHFIALSAE